MKNVIGIIIACFMLISCGSAPDLITIDPNIKKEDLVKYFPDAPKEKQGTSAKIRSSGCEEAPKLCISITEVEILKTPNDGGSHEEWDLYYMAIPSLDRTFIARYRLPRIRPPDNMNYWIDYGENEILDHVSDFRIQTYKTALTSGRVCSIMPEWIFAIRGDEDDGYFNRDDPIPKLTVVMNNKCLTDENPGNVLSCPSKILRTICKSNSSGSRAACYEFGACWDRR